MRHLLAVALVAMTTLLAVPATASEGGDDKPVGRLMLVLDSSGSMSELTGDGTPRIDAAQDALRAVIDQLPEDQPVGMRVFGATVAPGSASTDLCTDSQNVVSVDTGNRDDLEKAVDAYEPLGETPIGYALQEAGEDLGDEGQRSIVLVSDGEPNCEPDPCLVAEELRAEGVDVRIDVIGLDVDQTAREKLQCVADAGGGTYYDANDTASLIDGLTTAQTRSARPFDLTGEPIEGGREVGDAPDMQAPGQYLDTMPIDGELYYRIPRTQNGSTIHAGLTFPSESGTIGDGVNLSLYPASDVEGVSCVSTVAFGNAVGQSKPFFFGGISTWQEDASDPCNTDDEVVLKVDSFSAVNAGKPLEIAVYEEPPLAGGADSDLQPAPEAEPWSPLEPLTDPADDVVPGSSLASAPVLEDGSYTLDVSQGETQVFAVPLDFGQYLQAQFDATLTAETVDVAVAGSGIRVEVIGPLRTNDGISLYGEEPDDWTVTALSNMKAGTAFRTGAQTYDISYLNRAKSLSERGPAMPGLRYVRVSFEAPEGSANQPYTLTVATSGEAGEGAPEYDTSELPAPEADSSLVSSPVQNVDSEATSADGGGDDGGFPVLPVGLGAAGVLALLAAGALLLRSRVSARR